MARTPDIGSYFEKLTKRGKGGSRLDDEGGRSTPPSGSGSSGDGAPSIRGRLRDAVGKTREAAQRTAERARGGTSGSKRTTRPSDAVVTVEYTPALDGDPDPGDVVWVWVPYEEDPTQGKDRPVVVIGRRGDALVGVPLTTKRNDDEAQVEVGTGDWDPKRRVSYARIWRMLEVDPNEMRREGAVLERVRFDRIITAVDEYYDIRRVEAPSTTTRRRTAQAPADDDY